VDHAVVQGVDTVLMENITELNKKLRQLKQEIANYQDKCKHEFQSIRSLENNDIRVMCDKCDLALRWPSKNELKDWLKR
tara:strand:+ start:394 stop:630 length:237 start_codon:yes stop_codon:yes gene_type:complete